MMDIYFLNYILSHIVLNDGQWSVGFVLDSNNLTSSGDFQQRALKQLKEEKRDQVEQVEEKKRTSSFIDKVKETKHRHQHWQQMQQTDQPQKDMELKPQQPEEEWKKSHEVEKECQLQIQNFPEQIKETTV